MGTTPTVTILILVITGLVTLAAFMRPGLRERLIFNPIEIIQNKQYERLFTSALIHANWLHFGFNAFTLYSFGSNIEFVYGPKTLLFIYLSAILGGGVLSLIIHRNQEYRALGASGGVCGVVFASIFLIPGGSIVMFPLPFHIPTYIYAVGFLAYSFVGYWRGRDNIGHDAHLGGAIAGLLLAAMLDSEATFAEPWKFYTALGLAAAISCYFIFNPRQLSFRPLNPEPFSPGSARAREYDANQGLNEKKSEMDRLLDKVSREGIGKLSDSERKRLDELSREVYGAR